MTTQNSFVLFCLMWWLKPHFDLKEFWQSVCDEQWLCWIWGVTECDCFVNPLGSIGSGDELIEVEWDDGFDAFWNEINIYSCWNAKKPEKDQVAFFSNSSFLHLQHGIHMDL